VLACKNDRDCSNCSCNVAGKEKSKYGFCMATVFLCHIIKVNAFHASSMFFRDLPTQIFSIIHWVALPLFWSQAFLWLSRGYCWLYIINKWNYEATSRVVFFLLRFTNLLILLLLLSSSSSSSSCTYFIFSPVNANVISFLRIIINFLPLYRLSYFYIFILFF
jgi:hypothetical protein